MQGTAVNPAPQAGFDIDTNGLLAGNTIHLSYTDSLTGQVHNVSIVRVDDPSALPLDGSATADPNDEVIGVDFSGGLAGVVNALNAEFNGKVNFSSAGTTLRILDDGAANNSTINSVTATRTLTGFNGGGGELPFFTDAGVPYSGAITALGPQSLGYAGRITVNGALSVGSVAAGHVSDRHADRRRDTAEFHLQQARQQLRWRSRRIPASARRMRRSPERSARFCVR